jgi:hypothetical protein
LQIRARIFDWLSTNYHSTMTPTSADSTIFMVYICMNINKLGLLALSGLLFALPCRAWNGWQPMEGNVAPASGKRVIIPDEYRLYAADEAGLQSLFQTAGTDAATGSTLTLPMPDGSVQDFIIWKNALMDPALSSKYPGIMTFTAVAKKNSQVTAKIEWTMKGFHAMIFDGQQTSFIDPYSNARSPYYITYYRRNYTKPLDKIMSCMVDGAANAAEDTDAPDGPRARTINGSRLRTYRLALACTGEYALAVGGSVPSKASVLSAMVTTMNRVNGVYERELAVSMQLVANNDTLIFTDSLADPYSNNAGGAMLAQNQTTVTMRIGNANYDIGHVFSTGGGGVAILASVCRGNLKARGVTGLPTPVGDAFDIDFVAHEMGHQFGSEHTFNNNIHGSCTGNAETTTAFEPGSGSTIMAYAGLCSPDNIQQHSDAYFHAKSLIDITANIARTAIASCPVITVNGNKSLYVPAFTASYNIPYKTPFELTAPEALDSVRNDEKTYCWEQWNRGDFGARFTNTRLRGPIFRSFTPDTSRTRIFPALPRLLINSTNYLGEKLPDTARFLTFRLTTRSILNGIGTLNIPDDTIHLNVINTGVPFAITSPNTSSISWPAGSTQTVSWTVASTDAAPINCATVDIYLSADGGRTYPFLVQAGVPNAGTATITVPNGIVTAQARLKIKGSRNVFFDISNANFTITQGAATSIGTSGKLPAMQLYPQPATSELFIQTGNRESYGAALLNAQGQQVGVGTIAGDHVVPVAAYSRGIYFLKITNKRSGETSTMKVVLK